MLGFMAFTEMKSVIPLMNPYSWDIAFMELDRLLHFGQDPWQLLQPLFGSTAPTLTLNFIYNLWFFVMFGFWLASGWTQEDNGWERQFLLSFIWCWIIGGTILAIIFSSMGPAFYDLVNTSSNPYAAQMSFLQGINETHEVLALGTQDILREGYLNPSSGGFSGISAMPSLHNATSTLFMLAAYRIHKIFGHVMLAFLACIIIGSVHLAWHYAVDAYAGIIIALILWKLSGVALRWQDKRFFLHFVHIWLPICREQHRYPARCRELRQNNHDDDRQRRRQKNKPPVRMISGVGVWNCTRPKMTGRAIAAKPPTIGM